MKEFLRSNYLLLIFSFEILAVITGLLFYKKYKHMAAKYFIYFLFYLFICELLCTYTLFINNDGFLKFLKGTIFEKNYWLSTITWSIGSILFFSYYYYKIIESTTYKVIIKYSGIFFLIISVAQIIINFQDYFNRFFPLINVLGAIVVLICTILYFVEILQSETILKFYKSINFYISCAILIWWLIMTPLVFYDIYFNKTDWNFVILKWQIYLFANFFMYTTFTIGLIVSKPEKQIKLNKK